MPLRQHSNSCCHQARQLVVWLLVVFIFPLQRYTGVSYAYPLISEVHAEDKRCFRFNIPEDDDANMVFLVIPSEDEVEDDELEQYYVRQVNKLTMEKDARGLFQKRLPEEAPDAIAKKMSDYLKEHKGANMADLLVTVTSNPNRGQNAPGSQHNSYKTRYFMPLVLNQVRKTYEARSRFDKTKSRAERENLEGYGVCLVNNSEERDVQVILDIILTSDDPEVDEEAGGDGKDAGFQKDKHLTPLEVSLDHSIQAANSVLREMKFMEKREARMRQTADHINRRVRYFSYLSVAVLLSVTYFQVTYLKRYFRKKKLL